ncbi:hypothetical protein PQ456_07975 [Paenibacillus kyungheensis]|uniref:Uncharacterized protein n=1 Tax=Paenibacillus kyungheensis TaxID=1452732 RepID=A0AAX3M5I2_9BACL|nr:hypothetical protein [Paenibacillus kyungheensis]WCT57431.1 hypothetical protein PQ456_07975 [Paenibacillus kyungheensis]
MAVFLSEEERSLVKSYLLLVYIQKKFDRDAKSLEESNQLPSAGLYMEVIRSGMDRTNLLLSEVRRDLRSHNLRLYEIDQSATHIEAQILCSGHHGTFQLGITEFHQEANERMRAYLGLSPVPAVHTPSSYEDQGSPHPATVSNNTKLREPSRYSGYRPYRTGTLG